MNIVQVQAMKLMKERWFTAKEAVKISIDNQTKRWFVKDWKVTKRWQLYWELDSEKRALVRKATDKWYDINDFTFSWGEVYYSKSS